MFKNVTILPSVSKKPALFGPLAWIMLFAFVVRFAVRWTTGGPDFWENGYGFFFELAQNIAAGNGFAFGPDGATAFRVPVYPMFLAAVTFGHQVLLPVLVAQSLIGAGTVLCAAMLAREIFGNTGAAITAAALIAIYPYYVVHDTALQENSLYTFLLTLGVLLLLRARRSGSTVTSVGAGMALGTAVLTRANLAPFALFAPLWLAVAGGPGAVHWRRRLWVAILCASVGALMVSPWLIRSYRLTGSANLGTQTGFFLWLGNNPYTFSHYPAENIDRSQVFALASLSVQDRMKLDAYDDEVAKDEWFWKKGMDYIHENPLRTLGYGFRKLVDAFGWLPSPRRGLWPSLFHALSYGPVMVLGLWGMWVSRRQWREHSIFYAQFLSFAAVTAVFFGHTAYRAYLDVYWIVFSAGILAPLLSKYLNMRLKGGDKFGGIN